MLGLAILLAFQGLGLLIHQYGGVPLPGNVIGLMLLAAALFSGLVKLEWIERTASLLLRHMLLFFAPTIVGTIAFARLLGQEWLPLVAALVLSTAAVMLVTGKVAEALEPQPAPQPEAGAGTGSEPASRQRSQPPKKEGSP